MKDINLHIPSGEVVKVLLILSGAAILWYLKDVALIVLASIVIASAIEPMAHGLMKYKIPRVLAVLSVYTAFFAVFLGVIVFLIPPVLEETKSLFSSMPGYIEKVAGENISTKVSPSFQELSREISTILQGVKNGDFFAAISIVFGGFMSFLLIVVFSFYFAINEKGIEEFLRVITPKSKEKYVINLWRRTQNKIGLWMQGQLLLAVLIGVLVYLGLMIFGVPHALALAVIAAAFELIPVFGPILAAVPAVALAFLSGGWGLAILVIGFYIIIQQFENHLIYPLVVTKVVGVPPVISILALIVGAKLAGILGILLSIPVAAALQELFDDLGKNKNHKLRKVSSSTR